MLWIFFILIILFILFVPIKICISYENSKIKVFIYNFQIPLPKKRKKAQADIHKNKKHANRLKHWFSLERVKLYSSHTKKMRLKPSFKVAVSLVFGFDDAYYTALGYGVLSNTINTILHLLETFFHVKDYQIKVEPDFNSFIWVIKINSIICINIAKLIYMLFVFIKLNILIKKTKSMPNKQTTM